ncbi:hypothetical protein K6Q96_10525 [Grimontia kaedaensis]|uniref:Transcription regulator BetR N-terminal domain-containing protein n=1 Tax=Grimontia kaedaensis TaxID=2872157 RepID=A0ABY4WSL9_9GAMM|nr:helix-turn-helix domain-containing protein [Grimontia kaedaensis]USH01356.1 hypothetical protein K6Q96_10525 [Grimontia kaedaensis]
MIEHSLVYVIKQELKRREWPYKAFARKMNLSESSIKRLMSNGQFSLAQLNHIAHLFAIPLSNLLLQAEQSAQLPDQLSDMQEQYLANNVEALSCFHMLLNGWTISEIVNDYQWQLPEVIQIVIGLQKQGLLELNADDSVKLKTAAVIRWRDNGPVRQAFEKQIQQEFMQTGFSENDWFLFDALELSPSSVTIIENKLDALKHQIRQLSAADRTLPKHRRKAYATMLALKPWTFSLVAHKRRN